SFVFSSRRRHTRFSRDWSSDVCCSDLVELLLLRCVVGQIGRRCARAARIDEGEGLVKTHVADEIERFLEIAFRFPRETDDEVGKIGRASWRGSGYSAAAAVATKMNERR